MGSYEQGWRDAIAAAVAEIRRDYSRTLYDTAQVVESLQPPEPQQWEPREGDRVELCNRKPVYGTVESDCDGWVVRLDHGPLRYPGTTEQLRREWQPVEGE